MPALFRTPQSPLARAAVTGLFAVSVAAVPGNATPAYADAAPASQAHVPGTVLRPRPAAYVLPVRGYRLTGRFGDSSYHWRTVHTGLDFAAPSGTAIRSVGRGRVLAAGYDGRYGNKTVIRLLDGTVLWFCHQARIDVRAGELVRPGQVIGSVGSTGNVTGPHLHLEVHPRDGAPVDPLRWLQARRLHP